jgi:mannosyl-3-phosphoglycerate phosphatase
MLNGINMFEISSDPVGTIGAMAAAPCRLIVFSDLDSTLLDKQTYSWTPASEAIQSLRENNVPLVLASSKTLPEMLEVRRVLGNNAPFIFENGAGVALPAVIFPNAPQVVERNGLRIRLFGADRGKILNAMGRQRAAGHRFEGFADWTAQEVAAATGLDVAAAVLAKDRLATEPFLWRDTEEKWVQFLAVLEESGFRVVQGGRFWCAMGRFDKSDAACWLRDLYQVEAGEGELKTVALGDSPNDSQLLTWADITVIIKSQNSELIQLPDHPWTIRTSKTGPDGWQEAIAVILREHLSA